MGKIVKNGIEYGGSSGGQPYDDTELRNEIAELDDNVSQLSESITNIEGEVAEKITLADIPIATNNSTGLVRGNNARGTNVLASGEIAIYPAPESQIDGRSSDYRPITPKTLVHAVDSVITSKAATEQLTDEQKAAARARIGLGDYKKYAEFTLEERTARYEINDENMIYKDIFVIMYVYDNSEEPTNGRVQLSGYTGSGFSNIMQDSGPWIPRSQDEKRILIESKGCPTGFRRTEFSYNPSHYPANVNITKPKAPEILSRLRIDLGNIPAGTKFEIWVR